MRHKKKPNPIAKLLPLFKKNVIPDKRKKLLDKTEKKDLKDE